MSGWPALSPNAGGSWKNFAMSQSPPSFSPIRRGNRAPSESGSENAPSPEAVPDTQVGTPQQADPSADAAMDAGSAAHGDGESEDGGDEPERSEPVPGIQCLHPPAAKSEESEEEEEEQEEEGGHLEAADQADEVPQPSCHADEPPVQVKSEDVKMEVEEEDEELEVPQAQEEHPDAEVSGDEEEGEEEQQGEQPLEDDQAQPAEESLALVAAPQEACDSLVPADSQPTEPAQIVASAGNEAWGGALPSEAKQAWTVSEDYCSVEVAGKEMKLPKAVYDRLYGYQRQGVAWMWGLFQKGFGGILADEMGLGKTVQTAAFLACLKCTEQANRFLVVVPVTLLEQWKRELQAWAQATGLAVHVMHGSHQERRKALRGMVTKGGVLLISYDLVRNCISYIRTSGLACSSSSLPKKRKRDTRAVHDDDSPDEAPDAMPVEEGDQTRPWDVVIVDEAQAIKNPSCVSGRALRKIESRSRFLLTGTPLQNKLSDLWALMDFAQPGLLGNHATFEKNFSEQIAKGSKRNATRFAVELKDHLARELKRLTAPHFLRRLKDEVGLRPGTEAKANLGDNSAVQELPPKMDVVLWLNLTQAQQELYELFLGSDIVRRATGDSKCGMEALRAIAMLKKLCNHPLMNLPQDEFNQWRAQIAASGGGVESSQSSQGPPPVPAAAAPASVDDSMGLDDDSMGTQPAPECSQVLPRLRALVPGSVQGATLLSCKLRVLSILLPQLQKRGHRCLIFSQSTRMLDLIQACVLRQLGLKFLRIDGTIDAKDRDLKISKFQQENSRYFCICLSVQVGGTGLTITAADRVILVDPAWNPSVDAQAVDRVHRIGQTKPVVVYRLIGAGAIEDKMFRLQVFKRALSKTYLEHEGQVRFFSNKDLKQLFEPPNQSTSTQTLMAEQIGTEALEHEDLLRAVAGDIGSTDDPAALPFWQSSDVLGFSDYQRLFMFLEQAHKKEEDAVLKAKALTERLKSEEYVKDQVVDGKWRAHWREAQSKENLPPGAEAPEALPLQDAA